MGLEKITSVALSFFLAVGNLAGTARAQTRDADGASSRLVVKTALTSPKITPPVSNSPAYRERLTPAGSTPPGSQIVRTSDGELLWGENIFMRSQTASMAKIWALTAYYEKLKEMGPEAAKKFENTPLKATAMDATSVTQRQCIVKDREYLPRELEALSATNSCNTATVMLLSATQVFGSEEKAVEAMNALSKKLGLSAVWGNTTGSTYKMTPRLQEKSLNLASPMDFEKLKEYLDKEYPERMNVFGKPNVTIHGKTYKSTSGLMSWSPEELGEAIGAKKAWLVQYKTGTTRAAGQCQTGRMKIEDTDGKIYYEDFTIMKSQARIYNIIDLVKEGFARHKLREAGKENNLAAAAALTDKPPAVKSRPGEAIIPYIDPPPLHQQP